MALTLTIGGANFLPQYKTNTAKITETLQNRGNTMSLEINKKSAQSAPEEGKEIVFKDGARFLFGGFISRVEPVEIGKGDLIVYRVEATDYTYILINKNAQKVYTSQTLNAIVTDLISTYVDSGYGLTTTGVDTGPTIDTVSFNHIPLRKAFEKLAKITGYEWWVDYQKDINFKPKKAASAPETITDSSNNHMSLSIDADLSQVRNSIVVKGGKEETSAFFSQTIEADGVAREWILREKPTQVQHIKENTVAQNFGEDPTDEETGNDYMFNKAEKYVRVVVADPTPTAGTDIEVSYKYEVPVIVLLQDATSIGAIKALEGGDGIHEYTIFESSIKSKAEARQRALKELAEYADPLVNGVFTTRTGLLGAGSYFVPGQELTVNSPAWGINTDTKYQIQEVVTTLAEDGTNIEYHYQVRFGGRLLNSVAFLESLAGKEENVFATEEVDTIKAITESVTVAETITRNALLFEISESVSIAELIARVNNTPPFQYGAGGVPQGVWNASEWG
jgi:hypothetical protein